MFFPRTRMLLLLVLAALPGVAAANTLEVGPGKAFDRPSKAIAAAHEGDTVMIAPGTYTDCAVVTVNRLVISGTAPATPAVMTGPVCEGKAQLVTKGNDITLRNLTLKDAVADDGNGAGIRAEGIGLTIEHVSFIDNQNGILSAPQPDSTITIRDSNFTRNGVCNPVCAHGIYVNAAKLLHVENSVFSETHQGHHIKSRATRTEVVDCRITDGPQGTASYEIDIPNGGSVEVRGTMMEKGPLSGNRGTVISIGEEGDSNPSTGITIAHNLVVNDTTAPTTFVRNMTKTPAVLTGDELAGMKEIVALSGPGEVKPK